MNDRAAKPWLVWFVPVLGVSALLRLATILEHGPIRSGDTADYLLLAHRLGRLDLAGDLGQRVPLYPLFMLLLRYNVHLIQASQMVLGLVITAVIFWVVLTLTRRPSAAAAGAALYGWNLAQIRIESTLLSEALATLLVTLMAATIVWLWRDRTHHVALKLVSMSVCAGLLPLDRAAYAFVPLVACAVAVTWSPRTVRRVLLVAVIAFAPVLVWSTFNLSRVGSFGPSTGLGLNLTNKTGQYVEDAPQRFALIRDLYLQGLAEDGGDNVNSIWRHYRSMMAVTGQSFNELSGNFLRMNLELVSTHPWRYATNVAASYVDFFKFWGDGPLPLLGLPRASLYAWRLQAVLNGLVAASFLVLVVAWTVRAVSRRTVRPVTPLFWMSVIVLATDAVCAVIEYGDGARFGLPTQPVMFMVVVVGWVWAAEWWLSARGTPVHHHLLASREGS